MKIWKIALSLAFYFSLSASQSYADIRVGTVFFYPPFVMSDGAGFDIEFIKLICQRLQQECQLIPMDFNQLFKSLDSGKIDIAIGGITIPAEETGEYVYSLPYMLSKADFLILKNSAAKSLSDFYGNKIGVIKGRQDGGVFFDYLDTNYEGKFQILKYNDMEDIVTALTNTEISAAFIHESTASYWEQNGGNQFRVLTPPFPIGNGIAIMALPASSALIQNINQQIQKIEQDSVYLNLYNTYFGGEK